MKRFNAELLRVLGWRTSAAVLSVILSLAGGHPAQAGINVWTGNGPEGREVTALAIDPVTPSTLYAGTDGGVFKSTNGGATWEAANARLTDMDVTVLAIDPTTPAILYAGTVDGVFKSTDSGATWGAANTGLGAEPSVTALAIDATTPATLYVVTNETTLFRSTDGGGSWNALTAVARLTALAIDRSTPGTLDAAFWGDFGEFCSAAVYKSMDGGDSWDNLNACLGLPLHTLVVDPTAASTLYAAQTNGVIIKSTDAGNTWIPTGIGVPTTGRPAVLAIDPTTPGTLYGGTHGAGVFKSADAGTTWHALNTGLIETDIAVLAIDPSRPNIVHAGTADGVFSIQQVAARVVGTGTAASCTDAALDAALAPGGGLVTFDCGSAPATIDISTGTGTKYTNDATIDGGGLITISGGHRTRVFIGGGSFENLTIADGYDLNIDSGRGAASISPRTTR